MLIRSHRLVVVFVSAALGLTGAAWAASRAERLLPQQSLAYVSVGNLPNVIKVWGDRVLVGGKALASDEQYRTVRRELDPLADGPVSFFTFSRRGDDFRLVARCFAANGPFEPLAASDLDPLPGAPLVESLAGPGGWLIQTKADGWYLAGLILAGPRVPTGSKPKQGD